MPAVSQSQQKIMGMVYAYKKDGTLPDNSDMADKIKKMASSMSMDDVKDFASTSHKGLPEGMMRFKKFLPAREKHLQKRNIGNFIGIYISFDF